MVSILDAPDAGPVRAWLDDLAAGRFDLLVLMTGEAVRRLVGFAERGGAKEVGRRPRPDPDRHPRPQTGPGP